MGIDPCGLVQGRSGRDNNYSRTAFFVRFVESRLARWSALTEPGEMSFQWMDGGVKPSRPGVYPVKDVHATAAKYFARWTDVDIGDERIVELLTALEELHDNTHIDDWPHLLAALGQRHAVI